MKASGFAVTGILTLTLFLGCQSKTPGTVEGVLLVDGQPTGGFEVKLISLSDNSTALGASQADGTFKIYQGRARREILPARYRVVLTPTGMITGVPLPKINLPQKYLSETESDLYVDVNPGANVVKFEVNSN